MYGRSRRCALVGAALALRLAHAALAAPRHPLTGMGGRLNADRGYLSSVKWPLRRPGTFVLGTGRPAASPQVQPAPIASLAKVTQMLAIPVAGSETRFVAEMNAEAHTLGMDNPIYTDPSGADPRTVSTAADDQLRTFERAIRFPVFRQIISMPSVTVPVAGTLANCNPLIADGYAAKTGPDSAAEGCLAFFTHVTVGGRRLTAVGVVLGQGHGRTTRWRSSPPRTRPPGSWSSPWAADRHEHDRFARRGRPRRTRWRTRLSAVAGSRFAPRRRTDVNALTTHRRTHE